MNFYSTKDRSLSIPFHTAIFHGPAPDGGLYMPERIPHLPSDFFQTIDSKSIVDIGFEIIRPFTSMPAVDLHGIIERAFTFKAPLVELGHALRFLELFHGPTLAFKDFGARFMAQTMAYYRPTNEEINILVATSGDTGGAVASAFSGLEGFKVFILFPKGKVSPLQQRQLTTWDENIIAIEVDSTFDDCQRLVKTLFADKELRSKKTVGSANSINIARLLPQMVYYFEAYRQADNKSDLQIIVPSGNFGNLTAGLMAKKMGLPVSKFIAATNANDIVPVYLNTGVFTPRVSRETLSNAMDVGDPSNFVRIRDLFAGNDNIVKADPPSAGYLPYSSTWNNIRADVLPHVVSDQTTLSTIQKVWSSFGYLVDPHTAVAFDATNHYPGNNVVISTAHWAKFSETIHKAIGVDIPDIPGSLYSLLDKREKYLKIAPNFELLKSLLQGQ